MERRDRSLKALEEIIYITSLSDDFERGERLLEWGREYLVDNQEFDLEVNDLKKMADLVYMNMNFLKKHISQAKINLKNMEKIRKFFNN